MRLTLVNADLPSASPAVPLGLISLANAAARTGHSVTVRDYQLASAAGSRNPEVLARFCESGDPVLGVSTSGMALPLVLLALQRLKRVRPTLITVLGGIGAAGAAKQIIRDFPCVDFVCLGEGEQCLCELLDRLDRHHDPSSTAGFACRCVGVTCVNPYRARLESLDGVETRPWDYLDLARYSIINVSTARGCPFPCSFCDISPYWNHRCTTKRVDSVLREIEELFKRVAGGPRLVFVDDTLTINRRRVEALCEGLRRLPLGLEWSCYARADTLDKELVSTLAAGGCKKVYLGLESGSDSVLERVRKGFSSETGRRAALLAKETIEVVQTAFVWGFPFETWSDFYETLLLMGYLVAQGVSVKANVLTPLPFSSLFSEFASSIVFLADYSPQLHLAGYQTNGEIVELIRRHPRVFPCFYLYSSPTIIEKYCVLRKMRLSPEDIWDLWVEMRGPVPLLEPLPDVATPGAG